MTWRRRVPLPPTDELRARLGVNVRTCRKRLGISQHELGFRAEVHPNAISPLELGQKLPQIETFIRLASALEATPNDLVAGILWTPAEAVITPGDFDVPSDPELAAEATRLREASSAGRRRG
jgi:transcriptional regulator with XRE-family HTH domain